MGQLRQNETPGGRPVGISIDFLANEQNMSKRKINEALITKKFKPFVRNERCPGVQSVNFIERRGMTEGCGMLSYIILILINFVSITGV